MRPFSDWSADRSPSGRGNRIPHLHQGHADPVRQESALRFELEDAAEVSPFGRDHGCQFLRYGLEVERPRRVQDRLGMDEMVAGGMGVTSESSPPRRTGTATATSSPFVI